MNYKLKTGAGDMFGNVAEKAKEIAKDQIVTVEFEFNGITCLVDTNTNLEWLYRDYYNAHTMDWKVVGAVCYAEYEPEVTAELERRKEIAKEKADESNRVYEVKCKKEQKIVEKKTAGIELEIIPKKLDEYKEYVKANSEDGYSRAVIEYSEAWAKLMQTELAKGKSIPEIADATQKGLGDLGITGFQYGCAVKGLAHFWKHGEELRKWHNKEYGVSEDKKGVVNPAILTISTP